MNILLTREEILKISNNLIFTNHARKRIEERLGNFTEAQIVEKIKKASIGWNNVDGTINIAIDETFYILFREDNRKYVIITIKGKSDNDVPISRKIYLALQRKPFKTQRNKVIDNQIKNLRRNNKWKKRRTK